MYLYVAAKTSAQAEGQLILQDAAGTLTTVYTAGISGSNTITTGRPPTFIPYKRRIHVLGAFSQNLIYTEFQSAFEAGIPAPSSAPTLAAGAGTGITGIAIGYLTFVHKINDTLIHESALSAPSSSVSLSNKDRSWTSLPTVSVSRVTHIRGYVSMDGAEPRFAWERQLGATSVTENVATLALGAIPADGGVPPTAAYGTVYNQRLWYVANAYPDRLYFSELFIPEAVQPSSFINVPNGEAITGIKQHRDVLLIFTIRTTYAVTGWSAEDFSFRVVHPTIGCISHWSIADVYDRVWFAATDGVYMYDGAMHYMMQDLYEYWRDDYASNTNRYRLSQAVVENFWRTYQLWIPQTTKSFAYIGHFEEIQPELGGTISQPSWTFDKLDRTFTGIGKVLAFGDLAGADTVIGAYSNTKAYKHEVLTDTNDASDTFNKALTVRFKHHLFGDPGGDITEGKHFHRIWSYVEAENNTWTLKAYGGDEYAGDATTANWSDTTAGSVVSGKLRKTVHVHVPEKVSGRGLTVAITASSPNQMVIRGFGGTYGPGTATRGPS